jgi:uncharacterized protein CbrC (UPF0167 family)
MTEFNRRASDLKMHDIESMIAEENDPKQRSFLIILNSINNSLVANTSATSELSKNFSDHLKEFEAKVAADAKIMNEGRGMWKVAAWLIGVAQAVVLAGGMKLVSELGGIHEAADKIHAEQIADAIRIERLEKAK